MIGCNYTKIAQLLDLYVSQKIVRGLLLHDPRVVSLAIRPSGLQGHL